MGASSLSFREGPPEATLLEALLLLPGPIPERIPRPARGPTSTGMQVAGTRAVPSGPSAFESDTLPLENRSQRTLENRSQRSCTVRSRDTRPRGCARCYSRVTMTVLKQRRSSGGKTVLVGLMVAFAGLGIGPASVKADDRAAPSSSLFEITKPPTPSAEEAMNDAIRDGVTT